MDPSSNILQSSNPGPFYDTSPENLSAARTEFATVLDNGLIRDDEEIRRAHLGTRLSQASPSHTANLVLYPCSTEQVSRISRICWERCIPLTAYSGGTGLCGSLAATRGGVCIDFSKMNKISNLHHSDMDITAQPGVGWMQLNAELAKNGLFFPPDPAHGACIGGMVSFDLLLSHCISVFSQLRLDIPGFPL